MSPSIWTQLEEWGRIGLDGALSLIWQSSLLFAAVGIVSWALRERSATGRCRLWVGAVLVTPLLPWLTEVATRVGVPRVELAVLPERAHVRTAAPAPTPESLPGALPFTVTGEVAREKSAGTATGRPAEDAAPPLGLLDHPLALGALAYGGGCALLVLALALGHLKVARWTRRGAAVTDPRVLAAYDEACARFGRLRPPRLLSTPLLPTPMAVGIVRPAVLLPREGLDMWTETELKAVLVHELAHIRRGDPLMLQLVAVTRALVFFHPLVWIGVRRIVMLAEQAADASVVEAQVEPVPYAKLLTRLAENLRGRALLGDVAVGIALPKSAFLERIEAILALPGVRARRLTGTARAVTVLAVLSSLVAALLLPLVPQSRRVGAQDQTAEETREKAVSGEDERKLLAARGRDELVAPPRLLNFPEDREIGTIFVRPAGSSDYRSSTHHSGWKRLADARGELVVPGGQHAKLTVSKEGAIDLSFLEALAEDDLFALGLAFSGVQDESLGHVARLAGLRELDLVETSVTDAGLAPIGELVQLRSLSIGQGEIGDEGLAHLGGLENLEKLDVRSSSIRGPGLAHLRGLRRLHTLYLGSNEIDDEGILHLPRLESLENLYLWSNPITDAALPYLATFEGLQWLDLWSTNVTNDGLVHLRRMPHVRSLRLEGTRVSDEGIAHISGLTSLEELYLSRTEVGDGGVAHLVSLPRLKTLVLESTKVTSAVLPTLRRIESLEYVNVTGNDIDETALAGLVGHPSLRSIRVPSVTDTGLASLSRIPNLSSITVRDARITEAGLSLLSELPLEELQLTGGALSSEVLSSLAKLTKLTKLHLSTPHVTDAAIPLLVALEGLEELTLVKAQITGEGAVRLGELAKLRQLTLLSTTITAAGLAKARDVLPGVNVVVYPEPLPPVAEGDDTPLDWERWRALYRLEDGQVLKFIEPPFDPERLVNYRRESPGQAEAIPRGPDRMTFHWNGALENWAMGFGSGNDVEWALRYALRIPRTEYEIPKELLETELPGDWIVRPDAPKRQLLEALAQIMSVKLGRRVTVGREEIEREVVVARGKYEFRPASAKFGKDIDLYSDALNEDGSGGGGSGTLAEMFTWVGNRTNIEIVDETESSDAQVSWRNHRSTSREKLKEDPARRDLFLENLAAQTGLELRKETRSVKIWTLEAR